MSFKNMVGYSLVPNCGSSRHKENIILMTLKLFTLCISISSLYFIKFGFVIYF